MRNVFAINRFRWYYRLPIKWAIFGLTVLVVCFPYPTRLVSHIRHWQDPSALIDPNATVVESLVAELRPQLSGEATAREVLDQVERFVCRKVPYDWDWNTWGTADYLPTVEEVFESGREDCDGRAVVAASILKNLGYEAQLVSDFMHVWVKTDRGETMGPGKQKALTATDEGLKLNVLALTSVPRSLAFGIAVFPLTRELIVAAVLWLLMRRPGTRAMTGWFSLLLLLGGLLLIRVGSHDHRNAQLMVQLIGLLGWVAAVLVLVFRGRHSKTNRGRRVTAETTSDGAGRSL
ncbi:MAG: transglutaminase domain-containing protein [Phycisphaerae bacterium]|jgi:hypothetical protein